MKFNEQETQDLMESLQENLRSYLDPYNNATRIIGDKGKIICLETDVCNIVVKTFQEIKKPGSTDLFVNVLKPEEDE